MIKFGSGIDLLIPKTVPGGALFTVLWGGLVFAGLDVFQSTQRMIHTAEDQTRAFDPVNELLDLYILDNILLVPQRMLIYLFNKE